MPVRNMMRPRSKVSPPWETDAWIGIKASWDKRRNGYIRVGGREEQAYAFLDGGDTFAPFYLHPQAIYRTAMGDALVAFPRVPTIYREGDYEVSDPHVGPNRRRPRHEEGWFWDTRALDEHTHLGTVQAGPWIPAKSATGVGLFLVHYPAAYLNDARQPIDRGSGNLFSMEDEVPAVSTAGDLLSSSDYRDILSDLEKSAATLFATIRKLLEKK